MQEANAIYSKSKFYKVPSEWRVKKLEDISEFITKGATPTTYGFEWVEKGILFLKSDCVTDNGFALGQIMQISNKAHEYMNRSKVQSGDIIMSITGNIGRVGIIPDCIVEANINQHIARIRIKNESALNRFVYYQLSRKEVKRNYDKIKTGLAYPQISLEQVRKTEIILPSLKEQQKIVEILSTWDLAIEKQEQLIEKKKEFKKGLMQKLLSGEVRFKTGNGEEFPKWKKVKLGDYLVKHNEKSEINNQYPVLTSSRKGIFLQSEYYSGNEVASEDNTGYNVVPRGYFTYRHMSDDLIFKFNINDIVDKGIVSTLYPVFTVNDMDSYFLRVKLNEGNEFKRFAQAQKQGGSRTYMYFSKLETLKINIPCLQEQKKISEVLKESDKEIELLQKELETLKFQKKGLMQRLLTGEVRVNV